MAIVQISKIQQRSGNLVDLPQLDEAEFGWASDAKRLFIGKTTPNENIEVLTSYSTIDFNQINGSVGNLNISNITIADGQLLTYDGTNWVNRGGTAGGLITLGDVANVKLTGGAIGYVLETDGTGNLSWTPKSTISASIQNATKASPCVITTAEDNFFTEGALVTITNVPGMTQLNGGSYYANVISSNSFSLYTDSSFTTPVNSTAYGTFPYANVTATDTGTDQITVSDATPFTVNDPIIFGGNVDTANSDIIVGQTYYVKTKDTSAPNTWITISETVGGNTFSPRTTSGLTGFVYTTGGRAITSVGGSGTANAGGTTNSVQYNNSNLLDGDSNFTWDYTSQILNVNGNANVGNLNANGVATATRFISNVATGVAAPFTVTSTDRVANLNVSYANVSDFQVVTAQTTGTFYPVFVNSSGTGNRALGANANISFNAATGNLSVTLLDVTSNLSANNASIGNVLSVGANANVTGNLNVTANTNISGVINGNGSGITSLNASNITTGTLAQARLANSTLTLGSTTLTLGATTTAVTGLTSLSATTLTGTLTTNAQPNITSVGTLTSLNVSGNANTGNLGTSTLIATVGNISTINSGLLQNGNSNVTITANGNITINAVGGARITATSTGANVSGTLGVSGNANVGNLGAAQLLATANVTAPQLISNVATGTAPFVVTSTTQVANLNADTAGSATTAGTVTTNAQPNITSVGTLSSLSVTGNATAGNVYANSGTIGASLLTGTLTTAAQPNITSVGTLSSLSVSGVSNFAGNINFTGAKANLGSNGNVILTGGSSGQLLSTDGSGNLSWVSQGSVIGGAAGSNTQIQYNAVGLLAASANFTFNYATNALNVNGNIVSNSTVGGTSATLFGTTLTTGANTTAGSITGNWTLTAGSRMQATYADLAEYYEADDIYEPGTVLMFGGDKEVTIAEDGTNKVAGVVSTNPAYVMNATCPGLLTAIALQGRVPCKVRGKIKKGDMLISGGNGFARPEYFPTIGTVIGKALEDFDGYEGVIEVAVGRL